MALLPVAHYYAIVPVILTPVIAVTTPAPAANADQIRLAALVIARPAAALMPGVRPPANVCVAPATLPVTMSGLTPMAVSAIPVELMFVMLVAVVRLIPAPLLVLAG